MDWSLAQATAPMSIALAVGGLAGAVLGRWRMKVGIRASMLTGAALVGAGFNMCSLGVGGHNIGLLYAGVATCGIGLGCSYGPPIQALMEWFPDRKGLASGATVAGFGSGALVFTPLMQSLMASAAKAPTLVGSRDDVAAVVQDGRLFAQVGDQLQEVVFATQAELAKLPYGELAEGFYLVGSGSTGLTYSFSALGVLYAGIMSASALSIRRPASGFVPNGHHPPEASSSGDSYVHLDDIARVPQFWYLFGTSCMLAAGGMGLMSVARPMVTDIFSPLLPGVVTASFSASFLMAMAAGNLGGRLVWSTFSDTLGRRPTFAFFTVASVPLYLGMPFFINQVVTSQSDATLGPAYLAAFCGTSVAAITIMGGNFGTLAAYEADLFGVKFLDPIHGRMLLSGTFAAIFGPSVLLKLRANSEASAIRDLLQAIGPDKFREAFGTGIEQAEDLIASKTVTLSKLVSAAPPGTVDPSPFLYDNAMYAMAAMATVACLAHYRVGPVDKKFLRKGDQ